jgi:hypothetical protein
VGVVQAEAVLERAEAGALEAAEAALELLAEQALAGREWAEAGAPKQFIARMVKRNLRPALAAWFGTPRIEGAWPGTAVCCLAPELTEHAFALVEAPSGEKLAFLKTVACLGL